MTTYNIAALSNSILAFKKGVTLQIMRAMRDLTLSIAEADASVPDDLLPTVLLGTVATTSGGSVTFSGLDLAPFKFARLVFSSVSGTAGGEVTIGSSLKTVSTASGGASISGFADIELASGIGTSNTYSGVASFTMAASTGLTNASTSLAITATGGMTVFDAGTIRLYGMK